MKASDPDTAIVVNVTCADRAQADAIANALIEQRLAACVQSHAITSAFHWQGNVERSAEIMLTIKSRAGLFAKLERTVCALHAYDVPEILALPVLTGHAPYLDWLKQETGGHD